MTGFVVVDGAGAILRVGRSRSPEAQLGSDGAAVFRLDGWDGALISDQNVKIVNGEFVAIGGYAGPLPAGDLSAVVP